MENSVGTSTLQVSTLDSSSDLLQIGTSTGRVYFDITSGGNVGVSTTSATHKLSVWGAGTSGFFGISSTTSGDIFQVNPNGNIGVGTTSPGSLFSLNGIANWTSATTTYYAIGGINLAGGCFAINGTCVTGAGGGVSLSAANTWTALQQFNGGASTTALSVSNGSATTTVLGNATSTFGAGIQATALNVTGSATSSAANGLNITSGCFAIAGVCISGGAAFSSSASYTWSALQTFQAGVLSQASSTVVGDFNTTANVIHTLAGSTTFAVGANGLTTPALQIFASTTNAATGLALISNWAGNGVSLNTTSSGSNEALSINSKGTGNLSLNSPSGNTRLQVAGANQIQVSANTVTFTPGVRNSSASPAFSFTGATDVALLASAEAPDVTFDISHTKSHSSGNITVERNFLIKAPTETFSSGAANRTITDDATLGITGAPNAANALLTNSHALLISAGALNASTTNGFGLTVNAPTGALNNYAAEFLGGNVGIGTSSPYAQLTVWGADTASTSAFAVVNSASTTAFAVYNNGNATYAGSIFQSSDQRLKTNIQSLDASSSLSLIDKLNPVTFNWIDPNKGSAPQYGFIAQQVLPYFPDLVATTSPTALTPGGTLTLNYVGLISPIIKSIQALSQEIASIESAIAGFAQSVTTHHLSADEICAKDSAGETCIGREQLDALLAETNKSLTSVVTAGATSSASTPPVIKINGDDPATIQIGNTYSDLGASITGPTADLNLGIWASVDGATSTPAADLWLDTSSAGTHKITYSATDQNGLIGTATRTVNVVSKIQDISAGASSTPITDATSSTSTNGIGANASTTSQN